MVDVATPGQTLEWRNIGPHRGGRVVAVAGHPAKPMTFFFGAAAGGVWKTTDGGTYWENISDGFFNTASVGAIAVSEADPNVIYVGMGESCIRGDVSHGDGVYKSTDGGKTWTNVGLSNTQHISRIRIHPKDPDTVYVAALGHMTEPHEARGIYRSRDGGKTWDHVLFRHPDAGAADLSLDPTNPRILYATIWEANRTFWKLSSGGPESSIYKSLDGGDTWVDISDNPGLPKGLKGRMGIAVSPPKPERVWATIEAADDGSGVYRSEDAGNTWQRVSDEPNLQLRHWYYEHIFADPVDPETLYSLNVQAWKSIDGGKSFTALPTPHGDNHDLWIDPKDPQRMVEGNDGGACVSFNGGLTWSSIYNQPTAQFYHVAADNQSPYRVYGTQQDNSAMSVPSRSSRGAIPMQDCYSVGTSESGHIQVLPDDPNIIFSGAIGSSEGGGGALLRYDHRTQQQRVVTVWPELAGGVGPKDAKYRFQWTFPILLSPHDQNVLYCAGNMVFRSTDEGTSWEPISPDLTRNDVSKLEPSGGPITHDISGAEYYCTIFAFAESPLQEGLLWAGSDDGLIHISHNGGKDWQDVTPPGLPEWTQVGTIEPSPHDAAVAYVSATRYKVDNDFAPFLFKTEDFGKTWKSITNGVGEITRVIREDPSHRGLLYSGTETGVYVSLNDGEDWQSLQMNLPVCPVYDLIIKEDDLVLASHGRAFWILDDLQTLRQTYFDLDTAKVQLLRPRDKAQFRVAADASKATSAGSKSYKLGSLNLPITFYDTAKPEGGESRRVFLDAGTNPASGAVVHYHLPKDVDEELTLTFLDSRGGVIRAFSSKEAANAKDIPAEQRDPLAPAKQGLNRFEWNLRGTSATRVPGDVTTAGLLNGPAMPPSTYKVQLKIGDDIWEQSFALLKDPRIKATQEDLDAQFELLTSIRDTLSKTNESINQLRSVVAQIDEWTKRAEGRPDTEAITQAAGQVKDKLQAIEEQLIQKKARIPQDARLNHPSRLNNKIGILAAAVSSAESVPTKQSYEVLAHYSELLDEQLGLLEAVLAKDLEAFNQVVGKSGTAPVIPRST